MPDDDTQALLQAKGEAGSVELSHVASKYIGETEKNLGAVFSRSEIHDAALLFDEADVLFGKRSDVPTSDRGGSRRLRH
jgi:SpoVK/Ycf46/Vps4 family AAA+-type ATPase